MLGNDLSDNARFLTDVRFAAEAIGNEAIACPKTNLALKPIIKNDDTNCRDKHPMCRVRCNHEKREERLIENMFFFPDGNLAARIKLRNLQAKTWPLSKGELAALIISYSWKSYLNSLAQSQFCKGYQTIKQLLIITHGSVL